MSKHNRTRTTCRICYGPLHSLLVFDNMPAAAQNFPSKQELALDQAEQLEVCQCQCCGVVQLSCEPVPYYREVIRAAAFSDEMKTFRLQQFSTFVEQHHLSGKKVLEVGSGQGEYLDLMQTQGVDSWGIEAGSQQQPHPRIIQTYLDHSQQTIKQGPFDAFFCLNFLEHMPDLVGSLAAIKANLQADAVGLIEVPNFDMIIEQKLFSEFIKDHLFYFTEKTLTHLLEANGFEVISCQPVWHDYSLSAIVRYREPTDLSALVAFQNKIATMIDEFVQPFDQQEIAIWGAGHQALAVINLLELNKKVCCVVDSATFKQNKYTPGSHIPILAPEELRHRNIKAVIVMAASYSDEVARIIKRDYPPHLQVAVLRSDELEVF